MNSLIPMVVEQTTKVKELMILFKASKERIVFLVGPVNDAVASLVTAQLLFWSLKTLIKKLTFILIAQEG